VRPDQKRRDKVANKEISVVKKKCTLYWSNTEDAFRSSQVLANSTHFRMKSVKLLMHLKDFALRTGLQGNCSLGLLRKVFSWVQPPKHSFVGHYSHGPRRLGYHSCWWQTLASST
jgi:hypothetical protein